MIDEKEKADEGQEKLDMSEAVQESPELSTPNEETSPTAETQEEEKETIAETAATSEPTPTAEIAEEVTTEALQEPTPDETESKTEELPVVEETETTEKETESLTASEEDSSSEDEEDGKHEDHEELNEEEEHQDEVDYSKFSKEELEQAIAKIAAEESGFKKGKKIFAIREAYDVLFNQEKEEALGRFTSDGGSADDFDYKLDEVSQRFEEYFKILKQKRYKNAKELEAEKDRNLIKKTELLEKLREFVDNDENTESIGAMKKLQEEWKSIGPVPTAHNRTLWANYNALMDRYYDHRSIYFELKELDRKKNLTAKESLCKQAEELDALENINDAIKKLNELHEEYKHIGPIPKEVQEETWQRFKGASDKIYAKRKEFFSSLKETFEENYEKKVALAAQANELLSYTSDSIGEWNAKTKEVLELQKEWEKIGSMPKEKAKEINRRFWGGFKGFLDIRVNFLNH